MLTSTFLAGLALSLPQPAQGQPAPTPPAQGQTGQAAPQTPPAGGPTPPPEFIQAAQGFGQCVAAGAGQLAATVTPEAGAAQVLAGCASQKTALETQFEAWVASPAFPEAGRAPARQQFAAQMGQVEAQIADQIRRARATPAPAPTPSN